MRSTTKLGVAIRRADPDHALITTEMLQAEGLSSRDIANLVDDGVIERIIRGLYRPAGTRSPIQDIAAALHRHSGARASYVTGLYVHGFDVQPPRSPQIVLPPGSSSSNRLGVLHRSPLPDADCTRRRRLPVTTVARCLVDAAEYLDEQGLAVAVNEGITRRLTTLDRIIEVALRIETAPGRIGGGRLRAVLATWTAAIQPDSLAEAAAIRILRLDGLPAPITQHVVTDEDGEFIARVDMAWPDERVIREYDSFQWHGVDKIESDERRRQTLERLGWAVRPLYRHHLVAGERSWLDQLGHDLRRAGRQAS